MAFVILGEPASKANSRKFALVGPKDNQRPQFIKSQKARDYERHARQQIPEHCLVMMTGPVKVNCTIFYASERPDLDESIVLDCLQPKYSKLINGRELVRKGVILNDRQVREKHIWHRIDRVNPRAEIEVIALVPQALDLELRQVEEVPFG